MGGPELVESPGCQWLAWGAWAGAPNPSPEAAVPVAEPTEAETASPAAEVEAPVQTPTDDAEERTEVVAKVEAESASVTQTSWVLGRLSSSAIR